MGFYRFMKVHLVGILGHVLVGPFDLQREEADGFQVVAELAQKLAD